MSMESFAVCDECGTRVPFEARHVDPWPNIPAGWWSVSVRPSGNSPERGNGAGGMFCSREHARDWAFRALGEA